jgi:tetratricopeptide (TPR) repeat protein
LQWADTASLDLLRSMSQGVHRSPVLILMTSRPDPRVAPALRGVPLIEVGELEHQERREIIARCFQGAEVPEDVVRAIVERAGGNPFHIQELVDALLERNVVRVVKDEDQVSRVVRDVSVPISLPSSLEGVVAARLDELEDTTRRALRWLAVAGSGLEERQLVQIAGTDLQPSIQQLLERGFLVRRTNGTLGFASGVVRQIAYEGTAPEDRVRMHRRTAAYFRSAPNSPPARIAHHLEQAGALQDAAQAYLEAAERAGAVFANSNALSLYAHALRLLPDDPEDRFTAHAGRERILRFLGRKAEQEAELRAMEKIAQTEAVPGSIRAFALNRRARFDIDHGALEEAENTLKRARAVAIEDADRAAEIDTLRMLAEVGRDRGDSALALSLCDQALQRAGVLPDFLPARGLVLIQKGILLERAGRAREALETYAESTVVFRRLGIKRHEAVALDHLGAALSLLGSYQDAIAVTRASLCFDRETGDRLRLGRKLSLLAVYYDTLGEPERAGEFLAHSVDVLGAMGSIEATPGRKEAQCAMVELHLRRGEADVAAALLEEVRHKLGDHGPYLQARERVLSARVLAALPEEEISEQAARAGVRLAQHHHFLSMEVEAQAQLAELLALRERHDEAREAAERAREALRAGVAVDRPASVGAQLSRVYTLLGEEGLAEDALTDAQAALQEQAEAIRGDTAQHRFLESRDVQRILGSSTPRA